MRRRIHLHGTFAKFHDGPIEVVANTAWEAIEAVVNQIKGFKPDAAAGRKTIQAAGFPTIESLHQSTDVVDIHLMPAMTFGKNGGLIKTVIGVALIVVAIVAAPFTGGLSLNLIPMGLSMVVGGILEMITPQPKPSSQSHYLPSTQTTVAIGTPIALLYGTFKIGVQLMSLQIDARQ
jgi:predicted phage tail protein